MLLASGDIATTVAGGLLGIVSTFIPLWWKHRLDKSSLAAAAEREKKLELLLADLESDPAQREQETFAEEKAMEERIINAVKEFVNRNVGELRQDVKDLKSRVAILEKQVAGMSDGDDFGIREQDEVTPVPKGVGSLEARVRAHLDVQRLLNNANWRSTAEAAISELVRGQRCTDDSRRATATWKQVRAVVDKLRSQPM